MAGGAGDDSPRPDFGSRGGSSAISHLSFHIAERLAVAAERYSPLLAGVCALEPVRNRLRLLGLVDGLDPVRTELRSPRLQGLHHGTRNLANRNSVLRDFDHPTRGGHFDFDPVAAAVIALHLVDRM